MRDIDLEFQEFLLDLIMETNSDILTQQTYTSIDEFNAIFEGAREQFLYDVRQASTGAVKSLLRDDPNPLILTDLKEGKYSSLNFKPTAGMASAAKRAFEIRDSLPASEKCCTQVGLTRGRQLIARETLSPSTVKRMFSFFSRHEVDKQSAEWKNNPKSKGRQAWLIWGGDAGYSWSRKLVRQMENIDKS